MIHPLFKHVKQKTTKIGFGGLREIQLEPDYKGITALAAVKIS